ncbi:hypothetical protein [uncultured Chryseobacterium sp.]|uniref:hypothetical protein n=1 Tax=uncultured Chryseobacterium sp. TaxID=259322 RepID=UPI0025D203D0|nr:hypothetical protein [uncultured Chryseobacterium sp.]
MKRVKKILQFRLSGMHCISDQTVEKEGDGGPRFCISGGKQHSGSDLYQLSKPTSFIGEKRLLLQRLKN